MAGGRSESVSGEGGGMWAGVEGIEGGEGGVGGMYRRLTQTMRKMRGWENLSGMCGASDGDAGTGNNHFAKT